MVRWRLWSAFLATLFALTLSPLPSLAVSPPWLFGMTGGNQGRFNYIGKCALDAQGNLYITDQGNHRIQKFDPQGKFLKFYGGYGTGPGQFNYPWAVKVDGQGFIYVSDMMNSRIQKLRPDGSVALLINNAPARGLDVDVQGNIYAVDGSFSLLKYGPDGNLLWQVGHPYDPDNPNDPWYLAGSLGVALGPGGTVYVSSYGRGTITVFDTNGNFLSSHFLTDDQLYDVALDSQGNIYVAECNSFRIGKFDPNFNRLLTLPGDYYTGSVTVDPAGNIYFTNFLDQMIKTDAAGVRLLTLGSNGMGLQEFCKPTHLTRDHGGNIYVTDPIFRFSWNTYAYHEKLGNHRIRKLDHDGNLLFSFGQNGTGPGEFFHDPQGLSVDRDGTVYVGSNRYDQQDWWGPGFVQKFAPNGQFFSDFNTWEANSVLFSCQYLDASDLLYVPYRDSSTSKVAIDKFTQAGIKIGTLFSSDPSLYPVPKDVAVDGQGNIFICLDLYIAKFDPTGHLLWLLTGEESEAGLMRAFGLDVDESGNLWVADTYNHRIVCFDNDGKFLMQFGRQGFGPGEFQLPNDVAVAGDRLYVADTYNQRVQIFQLAMQVPIDIKPGSYPNSINLGSNGTVPVAIFSTPDFDATQVDPASVTLASAPVKLKGKGTYMFDIKDVNGDGLPDLLIHVDTTAFQLSVTDTQAVLEGQTYSGQRIRGVDSVRVVP